MARRGRLGSVVVGLVALLGGLLLAVPSADAASLFRGVKQADAGWGHTCAVRTDGTVWCWGRNTDGELGNGTSGDSVSRPVQVRNLTEVTQVAVGQHHSCALRANGTVWCWGDYIPLGTAADQLTPLRVTGLTGVAQISSAPTGTGTCAVRRVGTVWCWGNNDALQWYRPTPVRLAGLTGVVQLGTGYHHQCARLSTGAVRCWGYNDYGQLGNGTVFDSATPVAVTGLAGRVTQLDVSGWHSCVRKADASVWCWGWNAAGQIGDGSTTDRLVPTKSLMTNATSTQLGDYHTCARTKANRAKCWGGNGYGQLGNGSTVARPTPVAVVGLTGVKAVIAGREHTCAVLADTTMRCWGYNEDGQLGNGTTASSTFPTPVLT